MNQPVQVHLDILWDQTFELFKFLCKCISSQIIANKLDLFLNVIWWAGHTIILYNVLKFDFSIFLSGLEYLLLNSDLHLICLLIKSGSILYLRNWTPHWHWPERSHNIQLLLRNYCLLWYLSLRNEGKRTLRYHRSGLNDWSTGQRRGLAKRFGKTEGHWRRIQTLSACCRWWNWCSLRLETLLGTYIGSCLINCTLCCLFNFVSRIKNWSISWERSAWLFLLLRLLLSSSFLLLFLFRWLISLLIRLTCILLIVNF